MSVGTLITFRTREPRTAYLPLATESEFLGLWLPLASGLHWFPQFAGGVPIAPEDLPEVLREIGVVEAAVAASDLAPETKARMLRRASDLKRALESLCPDEVEEVFIG